MTQAQRPRDVELVAPAGWWPIELDPTRTERSIAALIDRQFRGRDDLPHIKAELARELGERAALAREGGGVQLWLCTELAGPIPLPASLLVTVVGSPPGGPGQGEFAAETLDALRVRFVERGDEAVMVKIGLGPALRTRRQVPLGDGADDMAATEVDFHCAIPGADRFLLMTFSTPMPVPELRDAFVELFDAMAGAARWVQ